MGFNISRYRGRIQREFEIEVVTPMFLGSANANEAELRVPSLKGLLRFWWRATCGISDVSALKNRENEIFGNTSYKAPFSIWIENPNNVKPVLKDLPKGDTFKVKTFTLGIIEYLAFGLRDHKKGYLRPHFPSGSKFTVKFMFLNKDQQDEVLPAFYSLIHFGGMGARMRNGFGSLSIVEPVKPPISLDGPMQTYSATSDNADLFLTQKVDYGKWEDALSAIGLAYKDARLSLEPRHQFKSRRLIAKPIVQDRESKKQRHAKPYFLHVGKATTGGYYGQILYMPYQYYQENLRKGYEVAGKQMNKKIKKMLAGGGQ